MKVFGHSSGTRIELEPKEALEFARKILRQGEWGNAHVRISIDAQGEVWTSPSSAEEV